MQRSTQEITKKAMFST